MIRDSIWLAINQCHQDRQDCCRSPILATTLGLCHLGFTPFFRTLLIKRPSCPRTYLFMNPAFDRCWRPLISLIISPSLMAGFPDNPYNLNPDHRTPPPFCLWAHTTITPHVTLTLHTHVVWCCVSVAYWIKCPTWDNEATLKRKSISISVCLSNSSPVH